MNTEQFQKLDLIMSESDILEDDAQVEFDEEGFSIVFGAISDWYNKSITVRYKGKCLPAEMFCLLYELAVWCITPRRERSKLSDVMRQYLETLPEPKISVRTHILG